LPEQLLNGFPRIVNLELSQKMFRNPHLPRLGFLTDDNLLDQYLSMPRKEREERFISTAQAAALTGLSVRTIQFWIETGSIQAIIIGRKYRVNVDSLRRYLTEQNDQVNNT